MPIIAFYITGHGLGHATRALGLITELCKREYCVHVISSIEQPFFDLNVGECLKKYFSYYRRMIDSGGIQKDALTVDPLLTLETYCNNIHLHHDQLIDFEIKFVQELKVDMIIVDVSSIPCAVGSKLNIPTIIVSNFTWDYCFLEMFEIISTDTNINIPTATLAIYKQMIDKCSQDYCGASYYIQVPGGTPLPRGYNEANVIQAPLTSRISKLSVLTELRHQLEIPNDSKILLLGFGGFQISELSSFQDSYLPDGWICLVVTGTSNSCTSSLPSTRWIPISYSAYIPDYVYLADVMIGKIGYGTCSECIYHGTPLIYIPRVNWPEERYLESMLLSYNAGICMSVDDFKSGNWNNYLFNAYTSINKWNWQSLRDFDSYGAIVDILVTKMTRLHQKEVEDKEVKVVEEDEEGESYMYK